MKKILVIFILMIFAIQAKAHGTEAHFYKDPGVLPGEFGYICDRFGEWFDVNLFTLSTKRKEEKKLDFASERLAEIDALLEAKNPPKKALDLAVRRYQDALRDTEYMAEKIIVLNGAEILLAREFENDTRTFEQVLAEVLPFTSFETRTSVLLALNETRIQNENIFKFMVKNYQFNKDDIELHKNIVEGHARLLSNLQQNLEFKLENFSAYLAELKKFEDAGLNIEAYDVIGKAKTAFYARLLAAD